MHANTVILGIDPGLTGGMAFIGADWCAAMDLPTRQEDDGFRAIDVRALAAQLQETIPAGAAVLCCMERLLPGGISKEHGRNNSYSIGVQYRTRALIEATVTLLGVDVEGCTPQQWKKLYGLTGKAADKKANVHAALELANTLYPPLADQLRLVKHHNRAEAVLIAHWFKKVRA